jgi:type II secretory pathway pseudopilin PulG
MVAEVSLRPRLRSQSGQGMIELVASLTVLAVAIAALVSLMAVGAVTLQRADQKGTAATLADKQLEVYRGSGYVDIRLDATAVNAISASNAYVTAHSSDSTIPARVTCSSSSGASGTPSGCLVVGGVTPETACPGVATDPPACLPIQTVVGPDHRTYEIDTYIQYATPSAGVITGRQLKQVLVVVRDPNRPGSPIIARNGSSFDQSGCAYNPAVLNASPCS